MAPLNIAEFEDLAAAYGADPAHWPEDRRAAAEALLAGPDGEMAQAVLDDARAMDNALRDLAEAERATPPEALTARILADAASVAATDAKSARPASEPARKPWLADLAETFGGWRTAAISAAACALIGLGMGFAAPDDAAASLGFSAAPQEDLAADLGWGSDAADLAMFGGAG